MKNLSLISITAVLLMISGCKDDKKEEEKVDIKDYAAIIQQVVYGKSAGSNVAIADAEKLSTVKQGFYASTKTDFRVMAYQNHYYHIGRNGIDTINKYETANPGSGFYGSSGYSLNDAGQKKSSNVHAVAFINDNSALLTRYGQKSAWLVNTQAKNASEFKAGEVDLSAYIASDDKASPVPEMSGAVAYNDKVFVVLQRLGDSTEKGGYKAVRPGYVAVIDAETKSEIDTKKGKNGLKGIELSIKNPQSIATSGNMLYISGVVYFGSTEYDGGLVSINMDTYEQKVLYDAKKETGKISGVTIVNNKAYVSIYHKWKVNSLAEVKTDGTLEIVKGYDKKHITLMATGPEGNLWLGIGGDGEAKKNARLEKLSKTELKVLDSTELDLDPVNIAFVKQ